VEIHRSARKHGVTDSGVHHAIAHAIVVIDLEPDSEPPKVLAIGPDDAGNLLEIIWIELDAGREVVIHAMGLRSTFQGLLDDWEQRE
jgi:hypothetical protein